MFDDVGVPFVVAATVAFFVLYFLPALVAFRRNAENRWLVLAVNALFGASVLGWFLALYLATRTAKEPRGTRPGDPEPVQGPPPEPA
ncbi:superinfection immunity protein [Streptomyces flavofungini]|uniref:Superinfection immunity protein n=1 Tax=Streptomyces flavofungini TaxID=68200 RepID=A0ABS0XDV0_9ACTN|nr:superinfection immunity protein [Streptomyces flavofungini]MBJ3811382.1 superinfection immunity protein [Streptomyces flavofungini]GHC42706.1 hypothetical protein GCM10010349_03680 [Streptomyces flavofungini]